ncbi:MULTISPECIES: ABC transporter ATP-binding protein [Moorena]|uniref:ABC transporter ATP-binding protein n=2 Tax=Moorena producens TaxID=1155739 RepID=A0A1D9FU47_MOOP1|nr:MULTISPECIES: ABC transporter ATP-binding protein [Moorena]AOY78908.1 ABC transporter ATP-binding protein [Moorena producens JHB]EGJ33454.1 ABC-type nitrate/sulfonate/bicarbonate transport system, ATPase component [Moorena producens 3L]NEP65234.1 ABC transporter ATP-binding protein [Moorena sp. SIO3A5]NER87235.1 ABC transporter ATP-binding protein [Moorena sp. SIO3A2]OLT63985.1 nitrate/sulfonate/bicarbonate ABC transporter ATP-binding protein [Moorena producens 3L]
MNQKPAISLTHVNKTFDNGTVALKDLNLNINKSEFISLVGPSGCGKSTLLRIIAGLSTMSSGNIEWSDRAHQKEIAFVFQEAALMPWATVMGNVRLPLKLARVSKKVADNAIKEALQLVGLESFARSYPRQLSGGMKMRVSIARALVTSPKVLLMDEPFGALDDITRTKLNLELLDLWSKKHWTVVFVTHNIYEAVYLSNRVVVMAARPGRVVADITIDEPSPRNEQFRTSLVYTKYCQKVAEQLSKGMNYE